MHNTLTARTKLAEAISKALEENFGHGLHEKCLSEAEFQMGRFSISETVSHAFLVQESLKSALKKASEAIDHVDITPLGASLGGPALHRIDFNFDPVKAESVYSDGKDTVISAEKDGKKYIVGKDGKATEVEDPDKYVSNFNKTTGSKYRKIESKAVEERLDDAITALDGTGCTLGDEDGILCFRGDEDLIKPIQAYIPEPAYGRDGLFGGYNPDTGAVEITLPDFMDEEDEAALLGFIDDAVNAIIAQHEIEYNCSADGWVDSIEEFGEVPEGPLCGFLGRSASSAVVKAIAERAPEALAAVASVILGDEAAPGVVAYYMPKSKELEPEPVDPEKPVIDAEMAELDAAHDAIVNSNLSED